MNTQAASGPPIWPHTTTRHLPRNNSRNRCFELGKSSRIVLVRQTLRAIPSRNRPLILLPHGVYAPLTIETAQRRADVWRPPVAPFPGAWIETIFAPSERLTHDHVAPFPGAWIETLPPTVAASAYSSPPSRGRGSKRDRGSRGKHRHHVAPFPGAWIETFSCDCGGDSICPSPPSRGRGSKHDL